MFVEAFRELGPVLFAVKSAAWAGLFLAWGQVGLADWLHQRIKNSLLLAWGKVVLALHFIVLLNTAVGMAGGTSRYLVPAYWAELGLYLALSVAAALGLWRLRVWPAGDAKLFIVLAALFPLMELPRPFHGGLRFLEILINVFFPAMGVLFLLALRFVQRTRLRHVVEFTRGLGFSRERDFVVGALRDALRGLLDRTKDAVALLKDPMTVLPDLLFWIAGVALMAVASYGLRDLVASDFAKSLVFLALLILWNRLTAWVGERGAMTGGLFLAAVFLFREPRIDWAELVRAFGNLSLFSLCLYGGLRWSASLLAGEAGAMLLPLATLVVGLVPWGLFGGFRGPGGWLETALIWSGMGVFFGLALIVVKFWDEETYESVRIEQAEPWMNPGPRLVEALRQDPDFFEEHFDPLYADGLTPEQVEVLRGWCERNGVREIPLAPTISFASWIFLGYVLTALLEGPVLRLVL